MTALRAYYLGTPLFMLFDLLWGLNVRAVALEHLPAARYLYYAFCLACYTHVLTRGPGGSEARRTGCSAYDTHHSRLAPRIV